MIKTFNLIFAFIIFAIRGFSQESTGEANNYQVRKEIYSQLMGFEIDTMLNTKLYLTIADWLYTGYQYGGSTKEGIDCSDFSSVLYAKAYDKFICGSSATIFSKSIPLEKSDLKEGDFVFFKINKKNVSHVGVYLTKNKFAHATVKNGVIISDLDEEYYKKYFFKGGRLAPDNN